MNKKTLFLRWALVVSLTVVGLIIAGVLGWLGKLYAMDATKITILISLVFVGATVWGGVLATRLDWVSERRHRSSQKPADSVMAAKEAERVRSETAKSVRQVQVDIGHGEYAASVCLQLGLLGTVIGLTMTFLGAFTGFQAANMEAVKHLIDQLAAGTATAFITTIVGLIGSLALSVQYHLLKQGIARLES